MPQSRSAGLLAFLLALPSLSLVVPPAAEATTAATSLQADSPQATAPPEAGPAPGEAMEARLRRLSAAIQARSQLRTEDQREGVEAEPWVAAGAWGNGRGRAWANRGWPNRVYGGSYYGRPVWANYRPGWGNFNNGPGFLNW